MIYDPEGDKKGMNYEEAWTLLCEYNQEPFHLQHAKTVAYVMEWFAKKLWV